MRGTVCFLFGILHEHNTNVKQVFGHGNYFSSTLKYRAKRNVIVWSKRNVIGFRLRRCQSIGSLRVFEGEFQFPAVAHFGVVSAAGVGIVDVDFNRSRHGSRISRVIIDRHIAVVVSIARA